jgi:hypothetical protein
MLFMVAAVRKPTSRNLRHSRACALLAVIRIESARWRSSGTARRRPHRSRNVTEPEPQPLLIRRYGRARFRVGHQRWPPRMGHSAACLDAAGPLPCQSRISRMHALRSTPLFPLRRPTPGPGQTHQ